MPIQNNGAKMNVDTFVRLDKVALEPPPNDTEFFENYPPNIVQGLGGKTAPTAGLAGMLPPQQSPKIIGTGPFGTAVFESAEGDVPRAFVLGSAAPPDRQDYTNDGGTITATPPPSVRKQESQRGIMDIVGDADMKELDKHNFFKPPEDPNEGK